MGPDKNGPLKILLYNKYQKLFPRAYYEVPWRSTLIRPCILSVTLKTRAESLYLNFLKNSENLIIFKKMSIAIPVFVNHK